MAKTVAFQVPITVTAAAGQVVHQPDSGWLDTEDAMEAAFDYTVLQNTDTTNAALSLQTAASPGGPWFFLCSLVAVPAAAGARNYASGREDATAHLQRYVRWVAGGAGTTAAWTMCFRICATLR